ncbi:MAG: hypothetical protein R2757_04445 [Draconibacterium sp.]
MKTLLTFLFISLASTVIYSQEKTIVSGGLSFPVIINPNHSPSDVYSISGLDFFIEKQISFFTDKSLQFSIIPGLNFIKFHEYYSTTGMGFWYEYDKYSKAASLYSKFTFCPNLKQVYWVTMYGGVDLGVYLWSDLKKIQNRKIQNQDNGRSFFNAEYYGFLLGIAPKQSDFFIVPKLEFSFYPNFVTMNEQKRNAVKISLIISIRSGKREKDKIAK